jgi:enoyl-CoA hydratase/carnithine racemase
MMIEIEAVEGARILRMNHGENRFNREFVDAFNLALDEMETEGSVRALVFTSSHEKIFSNGLDLNWIIGQPPEEWARFLIDFDRLLHRLFVYPKPTVAAINGHAFAGGLFMACCTDWRVMREDRGWCCVPEIDLGIELPPGNIALVAHTVGHRQADLLALTGRRLPAREAQAIGLVDEVAEADQVLPRALAKAKELGAKNPRIYASHKRGLRAGAARSLAEEDPPFILSMLKSKIQGG